MNIGLYIGSFDPFTNGHYEIIKQAEKLFDKLYVVISKNNNKKRRFSENLCLEAIKPYLNNNTEIFISDKLTTDIFQEKNCTYLIRGLRNTTDYLYEEQLLQMYKILYKDIRVIYLRANNNISSSFVYELFKNNKEIKDYIPYNKTVLTNGKGGSDE